MNLHLIILLIALGWTVPLSILLVALLRARQAPSQKGTKTRPVPH